MSGSMTVVISSGMPPALELRGPLDRSALAEALAVLEPGTSALRRHTTTHHTLYLPDDLSAGALGDLLTGPAPLPGGPGDVLPPLPQAPPKAPVPAPPGTEGTVPAASPRQREVLLDLMTAAPGSAPYVEQQHWRWYGPLDTGRYRETWASFAEREAVLRAALAAPGAPEGPRIAVHPRAVPQVDRHAHGTVDWAALLGSERLRAFDPYRPGPLRIALLDEQPGAQGPVRLLATYHQAFLDGRSVRLLLRAVHRAYLAGGRPPGGQRRPDVRDHLGWLERQDGGPARAFWSRAAPPPGAAVLPCPASAPSMSSASSTPSIASASSASPVRGHGCSTLRLTPGETARLRAWAASVGVTEGTALHAAWALLLHRAAGRPGPAPVAFAVAVSGRGIPLDGAALLPGPLRTVLPLSTEVDPALPLARLLRGLGERAVESAAYEWVAQEQVHAWSGRPAGERLTETQISFEGADFGPPDAAGPPGGAAPGPGPDGAAGVRLSPPGTVAAASGAPLSLSARYAANGALVLTLLNDRSRVGDQEAQEVLGRTVLLLREFPRLPAGTAPAADALALLGPTAPASAAAPAGAPAVVPGAPVLLRPAERPGAGTVLLVPPPGARTGLYEALARVYPGPQRLLTVAAPADTAACLAALRPALAAGEPVTLGCYSGGGALAYEVARRVAAHGWALPPVAIAGTPAATGRCTASLSRTLAAAARRP